MRCNHCETVNDPQRRFCSRCGGALAAACPLCLFVNEPGANFCGGCGARLDGAGPNVEPNVGPNVGPNVDPNVGARMERRQVTVLFADLSGYTKLTHQLDNEDVHALMRRYFDVVDTLVHRFGGTTTRHLGDAVMAVFGFPVAHTDDAERATRVAVGVHAAMEQLSRELDRVFEVHIGIASGDVIVSAESSDCSVTGESVNLASRLYDMAGPRETLLSDATYRAAARVLVCETVGDVDVKGFDQAVKVHRLVRLDPDRRRRDRHPLVGRQMELSQLSSIVNLCSSGGRGQTVLIRGEAGIGKTRLLDELLDIGASEGFQTHHGLILDFGVETSQDPIRLVVRSLLGHERPSVVLSTAADRAIDEGILVEDDRVFLNDLAGLPQPPELHTLFDAMGDERRRQGKRDALVKLMRGRAARCPQLLALEDVHWADSTLLDHLYSLSIAVSECRALLVMTTRFDGDPFGHRWLGSSMMTIDLAALGTRDALELASNFFETSSRIVRTCVERAAGNPLFLEQLLHATEDSVEGELPGSVRSIVMARMDQLDSDSREAIQAASVIGQRFERDLLRHLIELPEFDCRKLVEHHMIRPDGGGFLFTHALVREGVYSSMLKSRRRALHARAAEWYSSHDATLHAEHLDRAGDERAAMAYLHAARVDADAFRFESALSLVSRGEAAASGDEQCAALLRCRAEILQHLGSIEAALAAYERALALASSDAERCPIWIGLAACLSVVDRFDEALQMLDRAEAAACDADDQLALARVHHRRGNLYFPLGDIDGCLRAHHEACLLGRKLDDPELEADALSGLGDANYQRGSIVRAGEHYARCLELARRHDFGRIEISNRHMLGLTLYYRGQLRAAKRDCLTGADGAARAGQQRAEVAARCSVGPILHDLGETETAYRESDTGLTLARRLGARRFEPLSLITMARIDSNRGDDRAALGKLENAIAIARDTGTSFTGPWVMGATAAICGDRERAFACLDEGERLIAAGCLAHNVLWFHRDAMSVCLRFENWTRLERTIEALRAFTEEEPLPWSDFFIKRAQLLARYLRSPRDERWRKSLESLREEALRFSMANEAAALADLLR